MSAVLRTWIRGEVAVYKSLTGTVGRLATHDESLLQLSIVHRFRIDTALVIRPLLKPIMYIGYKCSKLIETGIV